jgi:hypothetical protein
MAHGGHLTINPKTGLPEAGFLSSMLPMLAGIALGPAGYGLSAAMAGVAGGALSMALNPQKGLMGGLMAGLGAYGGAGLGESLAMQGMGATVAPIGDAPAFASPAATPATTGQSLVTQNAAANPGGSYVEMTGTPPPTNAAAQTYSVAPPTTYVPKDLPPFTNGPQPGVVDDLVRMNPDPGANLSGNSTTQPWQTQSTSADPFSSSGAPAPKTSPTSISDIAPPPASMTAGERAMNPNGAGGPGTSYSVTPATSSQLKDLSMSDRFGALSKGFTGENLMNYAKENPMQAAGMLAGPVSEINKKEIPQRVVDRDLGQRYGYDPGRSDPLPYPNESGAGQTYFSPKYTKISNEEAKSRYGFAEGGQADAPQKGISSVSVPFAQPVQSAPTRDVMADYNDYVKGIGMAPQTGAMGIGVPTSTSGALVSGATYNPTTQRYVVPSTLPGDAPADSGGDGGGAAESGGYNPGDYTYGGAAAAAGGLMAAGGLSHLGDYSDGGRLLKGPGDGISDSIPAVIGQKQPARLADGEFVIPARIVSELGNGSTEAGAKRLYAMMDRVQKARGKTIGKSKIAKNSRADKYLPA